MVAKGVLKLLNMHMLLNEKNLLLTRNLALRTLGKLLIVFLTMVNPLYLFCSTAQGCCLLHLIKKNCLQKFFI